MTKAKVTRTSSDSATCEPIVLREGEATRLVFSPVIVKNQRDRLRPVKGELLWQRRAKGDEWEDEASRILTTMQAGSGVKLALSTDELHLLTLTVRGLYGFFWRNGLPHDDDEIDLTHWEKVAKEVGDPIELIGKVVEQSGIDSLSAVLKWAVESARGTPGRAGNAARHGFGQSRFPPFDVACVSKPLRLPCWTLTDKPVKSSKASVGHWLKPSSPGSTIVSRG